MLQGALIGLLTAMAMIFWHRRNAKLGTGLAGEIDRALADGSALTLAEVMARVGKSGFWGRGQVVQALGGLTGIQKVKVLPAPEGTPQLKKVDFIRYQRVQ